MRKGSGSHPQPLEFAPFQGRKWPVGSEVNSFSSCGHERVWRGCYKGQYDLWTAESYTHPAKMSPGLCHRIFDHLEEMGELHKGDIILDPMSGISTTLSCATLRGYAASGVELESKFVLYSLQNFSLLTRRLCICDEKSNTGYLRWLWEGFCAFGTPEGTEKEKAYLLQQGMSLQECGTSVSEISKDLPNLPPGLPSEASQCNLLQSPLPTPSKAAGISETPPTRDTREDSTRASGQADGRSKHELAGRDNDAGRLSLVTDSSRSVYSGTPLSDGEASESQAPIWRESPSSKRRQVGQSGGESDANINEFRAYTLAQFKRQCAKPAMSKVCPACGKPITPFPVIIQGDARGLSELLAERGLVAVSSPPYGEAQQGSGLASGMSHKDGHSLAGSGYFREEHSINPANIANLPDRPYVSVVSPPYGHPAKGLSEEEYENKRRLINEGRLRRGEIQGGIGKSGALGASQLAPEGYGNTPGQIGNLPDRPLTAITSPPYEDSGQEKRFRTEQETEDFAKNNLLFKRGRTIRAIKHVMNNWQSSGDSQGQIGQEQGDTYLSAMRQVYAELAKVASVLVVVVKNPTRNGKLRRLDLDTIALLEATGWHIHCQHQALLFEEQEQGHLFNGSQKQVKGRLSFFKRLAWQKGSPIAQWEDILFCVKGRG